MGEMWRPSPFFTACKQYAAAAPVVQALGLTSRPNQATAVHAQRGVAGGAEGEGGGSRAAAALPAAGRQGCTAELL